MLKALLSGVIPGAVTAPIEPAYWHTMNEFLTHAALVTLSVTVTGLLIAALIHFAVAGLSIARRPDLTTGPGGQGRPPVSRPVDHGPCGPKTVRQAPGS